MRYIYGILTGLCLATIGLDEITNFIQRLIVLFR